MATGTRRFILCAALILIGAASATVSSLLARDRPKGGTAQETLGTEVSVDAEGAVHLLTTVPLSSFTSPEAQAAFLEDQKLVKKWTKTINTTEQWNISEQRRMFTSRFQPALERSKALYPVDIT